MAEINAAYDLVRAAAQHEVPAARPTASTKPGKRGDWLLPALRRALGPELLDMLNPHEDVKLVTPTSTWASPRALLAVTDRRLLWLLDDVPVTRVHSLAFRNIARDRAQGAAQARHADGQGPRRPPPRRSTICARTLRPRSSST